MRLIDADKLCEEFKRRQKAALNWKEKAIMNDDLEIEIRADAVLGFLSEVKLTIDKAPTVIPEDFMNSYEEGYERAKKDFERLTGKCKKCDYRKFTEKFVDGIVEVMNNNGITSVEQLSEIIKGAGK